MSTKTKIAGFDFDDDLLKLVDETPLSFSDTDAEVAGEVKAAKAEAAAAKDELDLSGQARTEDMASLEKLVLPLLLTLLKPENLDKKYIFWPDRADQITAQIEKILAITRRTV